MFLVFVLKLLPWLDRAWSDMTATERRQPRSSLLLSRITILRYIDKTLGQFAKNWPCPKCL